MPFLFASSCTTRGCTLSSLGDKKMRKQNWEMKTRENETRDIETRGDKNQENKPGENKKESLTDIKNNQTSNN